MREFNDRSFTIIPGELGFWPSFQPRSGIDDICAIGTGCKRDEPLHNVLKPSTPLASVPLGTWSVDRYLGPGTRDRKLTPARRLPACWYRKGALLPYTSLVEWVTSYLEDDKALARVQDFFN